MTLAQTPGADMGMGSREQGARWRVIALTMVLCSGGCASYQYAKNVKMISFDGDVTKGKGVGPVRGESCQAFVLGYAISDAPTLDAAVANAKAKQDLRYMNNVSTDNSGFNALVYREYCLVAKGTGFK